MHKLRAKNHNSLEKKNNIFNMIEDPLLPTSFSAPFAHLPPPNGNDDDGSAAAPTAPLPPSAGEYDGYEGLLNSFLPSVASSAFPGLVGLVQ